MINRILSSILMGVVLTACCPFVADADVAISKEEKVSGSTVKLKPVAITSNAVIIAERVDINSNDLTQLSHATYEDMFRMLEGTNLQIISQTFVDAEKQYGVNAIALAAIAGEESGYGKSYLARTYNNLTGIAVYNENCNGRSFSSWSECIMETAKLLSENYLVEDGKYYSGGKGFIEVNQKYSSNSEWAKNCSYIANKVYLSKLEK